MKTRQKTTTRKILSSMDKNGFWGKRKGKDCARDKFAGMKTRICKVYFTFAGVDCLDIKRAIEKGIIGKNTVIIVIERDKTTAISIKKYLSTLSCRSYVHVGNLSDFDNLDEVLNGKKIDMAFFDYCGPMTESDVRWTEENNQFFDDGCKIGYTISTHIRRREYIDRVAHFFKKSNNISIFNYCLNAESDMIEDRHITAKENYLRESRAGVRERKNKYLQVCRHILSLIFNSECNFEKVFYYKDTVHGMAVIMFSLNRKGKNITPYLNKFIAYMDKFCPRIKKNNKRNKIKTEKQILEQKRKEAADILIQEGCNNKGQFRMTAGTKAAMARRCNKLNKNVNMQLAGIKSAIKKHSGYNGQLVTTKPDGTVISVE